MKYLLPCIICYACCAVFVYHIHSEQFEHDANEWILYVLAAFSAAMAFVLNVLLIREVM